MASDSSIWAICAKSSQPFSLGSVIGLAKGVYYQSLNLLVGTCKLSDFAEEGNYVRRPIDLTDWASSKLVNEYTFIGQTIERHCIKRTSGSQIEDYVSG